MGMTKWEYGSFKCTSAADVKDRMADLRKDGWHFVFLHEFHPRHAHIFQSVIKGIDHVKTCRDQGFNRSEPHG